MRVQLMSDLHLEFHGDAGGSLASACRAPDVDVLVLAGDIAVAEGIGPALELFSALYPHVVYVHGNHEYYGSTREQVIAHTRTACERLRNVHWLDADLVELNGQRFLGAPLWFRESDDTRRYKEHLNDFRQIAGYETWVYREHERARAFFEREMQSGDIVITHHLPTPASVLPQYHGHPLNCFFVSDMEAVIRTKRPALWMHGHTHGNVDVVCGQTRILCNPFGYVGWDENREFRDRFVIEV